MCSSKKVLQNPKGEKKGEIFFFLFLSEMGEEEMSSATKRERKKLGVYPDEKEFQRWFFFLFPPYPSANRPDGGIGRGKFLCF